MARFSLRIRIALGVAAVSVPAFASAPVGQYTKFSSDSTEIDDTMTGLKWDRYQIEKLSATEANLFCNATVFPAAGRVPTVKELLTLVDEDGHQSNEYDGKEYPYVYLDANAFPDRRTLYDAPYWTSTVDPVTGSYFALDFESGETTLHSASEMLNVRCVK